MLHAQCSLAPDSRDGVRKQGDIIVVALPDHPWGTRDKKDLFIVEWDDPTLEQELRRRRARGEAFPVKAIPYIVRNDSIVMKWSDKSVDPASIAQDVQVLDRSRTKNVIALADYRLRVSADAEPEPPVMDVFVPPPDPIPDPAPVPEVAVPVPPPAPLIEPPPDPSVVIPVPDPDPASPSPGIFGTISNAVKSMWNWMVG